MDNKVFNVNGSGDVLLLQTLKLCFAQKGYSPETVKSWAIKEDKGMILYWTDKAEKANPLPAAMDADSIFPIVTQWLKSEEAKNIKLTGWDKNADHDGSNSQGWRVYVEDWGHIGDDWSAICAITPAYMWHGK